MRSTIDLLLNDQQLNFLVNNESKRIFQSGNNFNWTDVDQSKWSQQYNNYEDVKQDYKNFFAQRKTYLENTYGSSKMPEKPTINYTGPSGFPLNELTFNTSNFNDPQGNNTFAALEWRIGEWSDPDNAMYNTSEEDIYEITPVWQSGELNNFNNTVNIDALNLSPGRSYKVRVRYKDNTGRWSYWSDPIEFIGGNPINYNSPDIKFAEIMFNPSVNCGSEFIEIYNNSNALQDLSYYSITGSVEYQFPEGASIAANDYKVLAKDSIAFYFKYGFSPDGEFTGDLSNTNDQINLTGHYNEPVNSISYTTNSPWPQNANGNSFALKAVNLNNSNGQNWELENYCGSPAAANSTISCNLISVNNTLTNQSCSDIADGSILLQASGGNAPYSYVWSNGLTGSSISNLSGGKYVVEIADNIGCLQMETFMILSQPAMNISKTVSDISYYAANDGSINITVTGGNAPYTFNWSNGTTTANLNNLAPGIYNVTVIDANGCEVSDSVTIQDVDCSSLSVTSSATNQSYYQTNDGTASLNVSGGVTPYAFNWSNGSASSNLSNLSPGTYSVVITDAVGCTIFNSVNIQAVNCSSLSLASSVTNQSYYQINNGSISLSVLGGETPYAYNWSNGAAAANLNNLAPGTYTVSVTDGVGCSLNETIVINPIVCNNIDVAVTTKHESCENDADGSLQITSIQNGTAPYATLWSTDITGTVTNNLAGGTYQLTITDVVGCTSNTNYTINAATSITATPTITNTTSPNNNTGAIDLVVNGGISPYSFYWSNAATTKDINNLPIGAYWVNITDANNCTFILSNIQVDSECSISIIQQNQSNLASGIFQAADFIQSNGKVKANQSVSFKAGICIELNNNFDVESGAEFEVKIDGCD